jgi:protein-disulfide isomerase
VASRLQRKQEARERRLAADRTAAAKRTRTRRVQTLARVGVPAIVVIAVAIAISAGSTGRSGLATGAAAKRIYAQVNSLLTGIPERGTQLGNPDARITLTFFGDLQCPICAAFASGGELDGVVGGLPQFVRDQVRTGRAKIVYRSFCTATCSDFSDGQSLFDEQQTAAYAAGVQSRFWYYEELFYRQQGREGTLYVTPGFLDQLAGQVHGLNLKSWASDRRDRALLSQVQGDGRAAVRQLPLVDGARGTPGLIMSGPAGTQFVGEGLVAYGQLEAAAKAVS